ncbi:MAG: hypothetical protein HZB14_02305 [Actinobacteria bacterium]|nr:hypothetical protein [Actinomycetota bacterium]
MSVPGRLALVVLCVSALVVVGCGGDDKPGQSSTAPMGVSSAIDGNATCDRRILDADSAAPGSVSVTLDELTYSTGYSDEPAKIRSGAHKGLYSWKGGSALTSERNAILELDRDQIDEARLLYDELDRDVSFDDVASTVRFSACQETDFIGSDEKMGKMTVWGGAVLTKQPELCLRGRLFSERNSESKPIVIALGRDCD